MVTWKWRPVWLHHSSPTPLPRPCPSPSCPWRATPSWVTNLVEAAISPLTQPALINRLWVRELFVSPELCSSLLGWKVFQDATEQQEIASSSTRLWPQCLNWVCVSSQWAMMSNVFYRSGRLLLAVINALCDNLMIKKTTWENISQSSKYSCLSVSVAPFPLTLDN